MKRKAQWHVLIFFVIFTSFLMASFSVPATAASVAPNDQHVSLQTYLKQIHAGDAWALATGSAKILIAVIDSGLDVDHPDFQDVVWTNPDEIPGDGIDNDANGYIDDINGWDFINNIPDPNPKFGGTFTVAGIHHGTLLAGIIAARGNNWIGISGISWRSRIMPLRVLNNEGEGNVYAVVQAIDYAIDKGVDIINLSFTSTVDSSFLRAAIQRAIRANITVVIAGGNDDTAAHGFDLAEHPVYPACTEFSERGAITVGATDVLGQKAFFSPYGSCLDIMAPGSDMFSTQVVQYERVGFDAFYGGGWSGTSLSTAMVTGTIALMKAVNASLTPAEIEAMIRAHCDPIDALNPAYAGKLGCGQLNAAKLVQAAIDRARNPNPFDQQQRQQTARIAVAAADGTSPLVLYTGAGVKATDRDPFFPYAPFRVPFSMSGSRSGATVVAAGPGGGPHVRVFARDGTLVSQFFAYDKRWRIGVVAVVGDVDGDGTEEIVTAPASSAGPHIKIFTLAGELKRHFFAYSESMRSGYALALGDLNNDGKSEIIISARLGPRGGEVKVFSGEGTPLTRFIAYPNNGIEEISVAVGDIDADGEEEIVVAPARGAAPVTIFSSVGAFRRAVFPYGSAYNRGISLAIGDLNGDRRKEIVVVPRTESPAHMMILNASGETVGTFFASDKKARTGFTLTIVP